MTYTPTDSSATGLSEIKRKVAQLRTEGYGDTPAHPHIPAVIDTPQGPALGWQAHCTGSGCGIFIEETIAEPPVDYLCPGCEATR